MIACKVNDAILPLLRGDTVDDARRNHAVHGDWKSIFSLADTDLLEEVCLENEKDVERLLGK
jgi:hypothetical protein